MDAGRAAASASRARKGAVKETSLLPEPKTVLPATPSTTSVRPPLAEPRPEGAVIRVPQLIPRPRMGKPRTGRVTGDACVVKVSPTPHPLTKEAGHPSP